MEFWAELLASLISFIFSILANIDLSGLTEAIAIARPYFQTILYFLPVETMSQILSVIIGIWGARIILRTVITIWDLLPLL